MQGATLIDLRSDTVTRPCAGMREAMAKAKVGDDVHGEDPTVNELERYLADLTGKEAAVLACSGTQSNLMALLSHCQRGHEYIVGQAAHTYLHEGGGAAVLGGIQPCPLLFNERGELDLAEVESNIKPDDSHFAISRLLCLENTQSGKVLSLDYMSRASKLAMQYGLRHHLDGARVFNAAVSQSIPVKEICQFFDSVSICLSKGLGAPMGSVLVGDAETIRAARRWRKMLGGGLRQAGIIAAAGLYALEHNVQRLEDDHRRCARLAAAISSSRGLEIAESPETNMLFLSERVDIDNLRTFFKSRDILVLGRRLVLHRDIDDRALDVVIDACQSYSGH